MVWRDSRTIRSFLAVSALLLAACSQEAEPLTLPPPTNNSTSPPPTTQTPQAITTEETLRDDMRRLWTQHVTWTRVVVIDALAGLPDTATATERLLRNQDEIGNAIKPFYGAAAGDRLGQLLREHILGAIRVVGAAKVGDSVALGAAMNAWLDNADAIASFLAAANPNWSREELQAMMHEHLALLTDEVKARLATDWAADIDAFDKTHTQILEMADMLTGGIAAQFPALVTPMTRTAPHEQLHLDTRKVWEEHVILTRIYIMAALAGLPDAPHAALRLLQNQTDIGNGIKGLYGEAAGEQLAFLLKVHIEFAADMIDAAKVGDTARFEARKTGWYINAHQIAEFLAKGNPFLPLGEIDEMMVMHLDQTLDEASARLAGDYAADVRAYDTVEAHMLHMSDVLSEAIFTQFGDRAIY
jgi:hypothetical protein